MLVSVVDLGVPAVMGTDEDGATEPVIPTPEDLRARRATSAVAHHHAQVRQAITDIVRVLRSCGKRINASSRTMPNGVATEVAAAFRARGWRVSVWEVPRPHMFAGRSVVRVGERCPECDGAGVLGGRPCAACAATSGTPGGTAP